MHLIQLARQRTFSIVSKEIQISDSSIPFDAKFLTHAFIKRVCENPFLWQPVGSIGDLFIISETGESLAHRKNVSFSNSPKSLPQGNYYTLTIEDSQQDSKSDPFTTDINYQQMVREAKQNSFLHPVIRYYSGPVLIYEYHVFEDLVKEQSIQRLEVFFRRTLNAATIEQFTF